MSEIGATEGSEGVGRRTFLVRAASVAAAGVATGAVVVPARAEDDTPRQPAAFGVPGRDFPQVGGNLANTNHSSLRTISRRTVHRLGGAWMTHLEGASTATGQQSTAVVQDGVLYVQTTQQNVFAIDGRTGVVIWKVGVGSQRTNMRGVALGQGLVFTTSGANVVYALDQKTGAVAWKTQLLDDVPGSGTLAGAIVYWDGLIFVGNAGGDGASHTFAAPDDHYFNDPIFPQITGRIVVQ